MFAFVAALLGFCMILWVAGQGLLPHASLEERFYAGATGAWTVFGFVLYHPAGMMRWLPHVVIARNLDQGLFAIGLIVLGVTGAYLLMGGE